MESLGIDKEIEEIAIENGGRYMDAVIEVCEKKDIDIAIMAKFLSKPIIEKIKIEGQEINLLPRETTAKLPV